MNKNKYKNDEEYRKLNMEIKKFSPKFQNFIINLLHNKSLTGGEIIRHLKTNFNLSERTFRRYLNTMIYQKKLIRSKAPHKRGNVFNYSLNPDYKFKDYKCIICGFKDVLDVHHSKDFGLVTLCPNHHAMIHRLNLNVTILKDIIDHHVGQ